MNRQFIKRNSRPINDIQSHCQEKCKLNENLVLHFIYQIGKKINFNKRAHIINLPVDR